MLPSKDALRQRSSPSSKVLSHKLANLAKLDEGDIDLIHSTASSSIREVPGGVALPDQKRFHRNFVRFRLGRSSESIRRWKTAGDQHHGRG